MSDFNENLRDLLKNLTKISDVTIEAKDEINKYLKLDKPNASAKKAIKKVLLNLKNNLVEEVANVQKYSKLDQDQPKENKSLSEDRTSQPDEEISHEEQPLEKDRLEENKENENEPKENVKPLLKIVDFSKLVDPRNLELMDINHKRKQTESNVSVIVLSSSDEEITESSKNQKSKKPVSQLSSSIKKKGWKKSETSTRIILKKFSDPEESGKQKSINLHKSKESLKEPSNSKVRSTREDYGKSTMENDDQFKRKPYVHLLRIPCEEMKSYYSSNKVQNESVLAISKSRTKKLPPVAILDEKTGEMINSEIASDMEKDLKSSRVSKNSRVSRKTQSRLSNKKSEHSKQKTNDKVTIISERSISPEKLEESCEDVPSKIVSKTNRKNTKEKSNPSNIKKKNNSKIEEKKSENEDHTPPEEFAEIQKNKTKVHEDSNEGSDSPNKSYDNSELPDGEVLKKSCDKSNEIEANMEIKESNLSESTNQRVRNRLPLVLPVPLSDSENDSSHEENSPNEIEQSAQKSKDKIEKRKNDSQLIESDDFNSLGKDKNIEDASISCGENTSAEEIHVSTEINGQFSKGDKPDEGNQDQLNETDSTKSGNEVNKTDDSLEVDERESNTTSSNKKQSKTLKETRSIKESSEIEDGVKIPQRDRGQNTINSKKNKLTKEKHSKNQEKQEDKENSESDSHQSKEGTSKTEKVIKKSSLTYQSDEDMFDDDSLQKNNDSTKVRKKNRRMKPSSLSSAIISDSEKDESTERRNDSSNSDSSDKKKKKRRKTRPTRTTISDSEEEELTKEKNEDSSKKVSPDKGRKHKEKRPKSTSCSSSSDTKKYSPRKKKNEKSSDSDSPNMEKERPNSSSRISPSDSDKDESIEKINKNSSDSDSPNMKKKNKETRPHSSSRSSPDSEEEAPNKKKNDNSSDSDSPNMEKKYKKTQPRSSSRSSPSDSEEDAPNKKRNENSSDSDMKMKRKRSEQNSSDKEINVSSEDSEDFSVYYKKNKLLKSRQTNKKMKMKRLNSDSEDDAEVEKDENSGSECENKKTDEDCGNNSSESVSKKTSSKKRRIIMNEDSDSDDDKTTRKKIKKVISKKSLSDSTKKAEAEEKERKQRILDKQKKYNQIYENLDISSSKVDKLVLDIDEETDEPLLQVNKSLVSKLKPHQASGIQFMWDACFESLKRAEKSEGSGCIVAHCMGLGKTLQVIALVNTLLEDAEKTKVRKVLVVTPLSTVLNWKAEFANWLSGDEDYEIYELVSCRPQNAERSYHIRQWHKNGGVLIMSYSMFRNLSNEKNKKVSKKIRETFAEGLVDPGPDLVVCDEGHLLKNEKTGLSIAMNKIKTRRRIVLTGTPLQNNLKEYYCMVQFVKPNLLGTYKEYLNRFVNPITNGQYTDSTEYDINIMRRRSHVLHKLLEGVVQRRDYSVLSPYLPPKFEYILFLTLTDTQKKLYSHYLKHFARRSKDESTNKTSYLFQDFQALSRICIHPRVMLDKSVDDQNKYQSDEESIGSLKNFIDDESDSTSTTGSESESDKSSESGKQKGRPRRVTRAQKSAANPGSESEDEEEVGKEWWQEYCDGDELDNLANSTKMLVLFEILKECEQIGDKVLVFSQSLYALNAIEYFLEKVDEATQNGNADEKTCGYTGSWAPGLDYFRLDGSTNCNLRSNWCDTFNKESNTRARLFLLSTRAGGLGINLVAANRVIIFDVSWNPSSDIQSIYRVYRFGQLKPSYIYRFVMYGTMEMKIYERQVTKQAISKRVIDEQQIDRHYNQHDLGELYKFEQPRAEDRPTPLVPKDVLLADLLQHHEDKIFKYHEHQSLLENKEDETLNEEERKAAWDEFENEKVERTKQTLIGKFSVSTVQLALKSIIQRDNPTWNNSQILSIIPQLIQQLNIQLGAKDMTMYNRIAAEIKLMQEEYTRKMQLQFYQYRMQMEAQRQQQLGMFGSHPPPLAGFNNFQQLPRFAHNPAFRPSLPGSSTLNPSEIVELN